MSNEQTERESSLKAGDRIILAMMNFHEALRRDGFDPPVKIALGRRAYIAVVESVSARTFVRGPCSDGDYLPEYVLFDNVELRER
jgi:hypothetical protein